MLFRHRDIEIPEDNPFANCKLERKKYAVLLTEIVTMGSDGFVMAINNEWGTGKTTFVKMWRAKLKQEEFETVYFNAWENDFDRNALAAILGELKTLTEDGHQELFENVLKKSAVIAAKVVPLAFKAMVKHYTGEDLGDLAQAAAEGYIENIEEDVKEYAKKKKGVKAFKDKLTEFVEATCGDKPLVFIVDELDRCRPDYAVEVLEQIKHFFSIPKIVFALSIDKVQLANAIRGYYGSDKIEGEEYLRRFIDIEYSIPAPDTRLFCTYIFSYFDYEQYFQGARKDVAVFMTDYEDLIEFSVALFNAKNTSLRQQEKILAHARVAMDAFKPEDYVFPSLIIMLVYLRTLDQEFYKQLIRKAFVVNDILNLLEHKFHLRSLTIQQKEVLLAMESLLIVLYNNYNEIDKRPVKQIINEINSPRRKFNSVVTSDLIKENESKFYTHLLADANNPAYGNISLKYLLDKIDLIQSNTRLFTTI